LETLSLLGPAVFCAIKGNKELRASNIKGVMRANKTEIPVFPLTSRPDIATATWLAHAAPPAKPAGRKLEGLTPEAAAEAAYEALKAWGAA
jgi:electron transfer flavoprotein alpha/beta subunit